jgi:hypothetical protein
MRSIHSIKLELLPSPRIRVERVNSFELKFNSSITLIFYEKSKSLSSKETIIAKLKLKDLKKKIIRRKVYDLI